MKQQVLFFFFTLMLTGISVSAQTGGGRIAGVVIDNAGEEPLPGATIFIEELKKGIVTDGHGEFLLSDVPAATYTLTVRFIGYHTQTRKLTVGKERGKKIIIRVPLIQGFNADETAVKAITDFAADELHVGEIHFLPYHTLGLFKWQKLGIPYPLPDAVPPTAEQVKRAEELLEVNRYPG